MAFDLPDILDSCRRVVAEARHLRIDEPALSRRAASIDPARLSVPQPPEPLRFQGSREDGANFTLLCDCLNFCFWSEVPWIVSFAGREWTRTYAMLAGVVRAVTQDAQWLRPECWRVAGEEDVRRVFAGKGEIPLLTERVHVLNEIGDVLITAYGGEFVNLVEQAGRDAPSVAQFLARDFPSFNDVAEYRGQPVAFLKRAQICAADLAALWHGLPAHESTGKMPVPHSSLSGLDRLTVFADYRLPQLFRHWGILRLTPLLEDRIDSREIIPAGSEAEVEIRAATVVIGDRLARALGASPWKLDYFLWESSHDPRVTVEHHRTPTIYY